MQRPPRAGGGRFDDGLLLLVAVVLEPDFDLRGGELQQFCEVFSLLRRQVALLSKSSLEFKGRRLGKENPPTLSLQRSSGHLRSTLVGQRPAPAAAP